MYRRWVHNPDIFPWLIDHAFAIAAMLPEQPPEGPFLHKQIAPHDRRLGSLQDRTTAVPALAGADPPYFGTFNPNPLPLFSSNARDSRRRCLHAENRPRVTTSGFSPLASPKLTPRCPNRSALAMIQGRSSLAHPKNCW